MIVRVVLLILISLHSLRSGWVSASLSQSTTALLRYNITDPRLMRGGPVRIAAQRMRVLSETESATASSRGVIKSELRRLARIASCDPNLFEATKEIDFRSQYLVFMFPRTHLDCDVGRWKQNYVRLASTLIGPKMSKS